GGGCAGGFYQFGRQVAGGRGEVRRQHGRSGGGGRVAEGLWRGHGGGGSRGGGLGSAVRASWVAGGSRGARWSPADGAWRRAGPRATCWIANGFVGCTATVC